MFPSGKANIFHRQEPAQANALQISGLEADLKRTKLERTSKGT